MSGSYSPRSSSSSAGLPHSDHAKLFHRSRISGRASSEGAMRPSVPRSTPIAIPTPSKPLSFLAQQAMLSEYNQQYKQQRAQSRNSQDNEHHSNMVHECDADCDQYCDLALNSGSSTDDETDSWLRLPEPNQAARDPFPVSRSIDFDWTS